MQGESVTGATSRGCPEGLHPMIILKADAESCILGQLILKMTTLIDVNKKRQNMT